MKHLLSILMLLGLVAFCHCSYGEAAVDYAAKDGKASATENSVAEGHLLTIAGHPVSVFRATVFNVGPAERVAKIETRIKGLCRKGIWGPVSTTRRAEGTVFFIGDNLAFMLANGDCDAASGENMDQVAAMVKRNLEAALAEEKLFQSWPYLIKEALWALGGTVLLILFLFSCHWLMRRFSRLMENFEAKIVAKINVRGYRLLDHLVMFTRSVMRLILACVVLASIFGWFTFILHCIPSTRQWGIRINTYLIDSLKLLGVTILKAIPNLIVVVLIFIIISFLVRFVRIFFRGVAERSIHIGGLVPELARPTSNIAAIMLWLLALIMAYPYLPGSSSDAFKGITIFAGVIISLGSANIFAQLMAGITLMYSRAFKADDSIQVGDIVGRVLSVGYLSTRIRTVKDEEINIPNAILLSTSSKNLTNSMTENGLLVQVRVGIGYNAPWRTVHRLLIDAAKKTEGISAREEPYVLQLELGDYYVHYELNARLSRLEGRRLVLSRLFAQIQDEFNLAGVQIMSPHYHSDPSAPVVIPPEQWGDSSEVSQREPGSS